MNIPRITIAGTNSGCGKTTVTAGILAALLKRGMRVQPYKVGPDYIDPMFHTFITGRESRNLDSWMLDWDILVSLFLRNAAYADIAVIEGVMGLYDGYGGNTILGSTAHVSGIVKSPVILVVNGEGMSLSIAALIKGYIDFNSETDIRGIILNGIKSDHHYSILKEIILENTGINTLGYLPRQDAYRLESRHLGLVPSEEVAGLKEKINLLAGQIEKTIDIDGILKVAAEAKELSVPEEKAGFRKLEQQCRIAVARDKAFNFYYRDNLDLLEMLGAELVPFSPVTDDGIPDGVSGLYMGGGYPEVWAYELEGNISMKKSIRKSIDDGMPVYAECGGLMYLSDSIRDKQGREYGMVGAIPGRSEMTSSLKRFGYVEIEAVDDSIIAKRGDRIRAHEFHYSVTAVEGHVPTCFKVVKSRSGGRSTEWSCGFKVGNILAGYPHLHFWSNTDFAVRFVESCTKYSNTGKL